MAMLYALLMYTPFLSSYFSIEVPQEIYLITPHLSLAVVIMGILSLSCSVMIYHVCPRPFWKGSRTWYKFFGTSILLGSISIIFFGVVYGFIYHPEELNVLVRKDGKTLLMILLSASIFKLILEASFFANLNSKITNVLKRSARLMLGDLRPLTMLRFFAGGLGGIIIPLVLLSGVEFSNPSTMILVLVSASFVLQLLGELLERHLFFIAGVSDSMPGGN